MLEELPFCLSQKGHFKNLKLSTCTVSEKNVQLQTDGRIKEQVNVHISFLGICAVQHGGGRGAEGAAAPPQIGT